FGFIRMSVAGMTAQAAGAENETEARTSLVHGAGLGALIGLALVLLQAPIGAFSFQLLSLGSDASMDTFNAARDYFDVRIWGAPFVLATYACFGWMTARGRTDYLMAASLFITVLNIGLDYWFVVGFGWGAKGVAAGTLIAEVAGFFVCAGLVAAITHAHGGVRACWSRDSIAHPAGLKRALAVNRDVFIRTLLLAFSFAWFVQRGGAFGDVTLAANQTLLQLFLFTGLALDGTAIAAETLVGRAIGASDPTHGLARYRSAVRRTFVLAMAAALFFVTLYGLGGDILVGFLTPEGSIRDASLDFLPWVAVSPLIVVIGFQLDGIFIGATRAKEMRDGMIASVAVYVPATIYFADHAGNHGLWAAFSLYFLLRAVTLAVYMPRIRKGFEA
ncbi:MAG: MATE family efflux transporter, partial [Parvularculaceae bacterium]